MQAESPLGRQTPKPRDPFTGVLEKSWSIAYTVSHGTLNATCEEGCACVCFSMCIRVCILYSVLTVLREIAYCKKLVCWSLLDENDNRFKEKPTVTVIHHSY